MKIVIIEDEPLTAKDLAGCILKADPSAEIVTFLASVRESIAYFKENPDPDVIFSDIQLGDGISFEIFSTFPKAIPVIFCTAYDEYALKAFKSAGIDYILKPFTVKTISNAMVKYNELKERFSESAPSPEAIATVFENLYNKKQNTVLVHYKDKILPIPADDIVLFVLQNEVTQLLTANKQQYSTNKTLEEIERTLSGDFYRVNRQYLVNRKAIKDISYYFNRKLLINLNIPFEDKITVSKVKASHFLSWLSEN